MNRPSRRRLLAAACGVTMGGLAGCRGLSDLGTTPTERVTPAPVPATPTPREGETSRVVTFDGLGPVDVAATPNGALYMAMGISGQIRRLPADRTTETGLTVSETDLVARLDPGNGFLYALDVLDETVYAARSSRHSSTHGIWQLSDGGDASRLAALDPRRRLRGLLVDGDRRRLLVTNARRGLLLTVDLDDGTTAEWFDDSLLDASVRGPTGLAWLGESVCVTNNERGRLVQIPVEADGSAGAPTALVENATRLSGASGVATDGQALYVAAANLNRIVRVEQSGELRTLATDDDGLDIPTGVATAPDNDELFVTNFGFEEMVGVTGDPSLSRLRL
jgi:DNA-binding beta-propeller fold protein YncE